MLIIPVYAEDENHRDVNSTSKRVLKVAVTVMNKPRTDIIHDTVVINLNTTCKTRVPFVFTIYYVK